MPLSVLICEDHTAQRNHIETAITKHAANEGYDINILLSTPDPDELLEYAQKHPDKNRLYIFDVDLGSDKIDGITLAAKIREFDTFSKLIFVTTHSKLAALIFKYRLEALDYIVKDDTNNIAEQVCDCIDFAYSRSFNNVEQEDLFTVNINTGLISIPVADIISIESAQSGYKKITLYTKSDRFEFSGSLSQIEPINPAFYRCHKSYVVNVANIRSIKRLTNSTGEAEMINGSRIPLNRKSITKLKELLLSTKTT